VTQQALFVKNKIRLTRGKMQAPNNDA